MRSNWMWLLTTTALSAATILPITAHTADESGGGAHGGIGIYRNGTIHLLDLVEAGIENNPYYDATIVSNPRYRKRVEVALRNIFTPQSIEVRLIASKLTELGQKAPFMAEMFLDALELYTWRSNNEPLRNPGDDRTLLQLKDSDKVPLAIRKGRTIYVSKQGLWLMPIKQRPALFYHEIFYSLTVPEVVPGVQFCTQVKKLARDSEGVARKTPSGTYIFEPVTVCEPVKEQTSDGTKAFLGYLFSQDIAAPGNALLERHAWFLPKDAYLHSPPWFRKVGSAAISTLDNPQIVLLSSSAKTKIRFNWPSLKPQECGSEQDCVESVDAFCQVVSNHYFAARTAQGKRTTFFSTYWDSKKNRHEIVSHSDEPKNLGPLIDSGAPKTLDECRQSVDRILATTPKEFEGYVVDEN